MTDEQKSEREKIEEYFGLNLKNIESVRKRNKILLKSLRRDDNKLIQLVSLVVELPGNKSRNLFRYGVDIQLLRQGFNRGYKEPSGWFNRNSPDECAIGPDRLKKLGLSIREIEEIGFPLYKIFRYEDIQLEDLVKEGYPLEIIWQNGFVSRLDFDLLFAGYSRKDIEDFTKRNLAMIFRNFNLEREEWGGHHKEARVKVLLEKGFTGEELRRAGYSAYDLSKGGLSPNQLLEAGYPTEYVRSVMNRKKKSS